MDPNIAVELTMARHAEMTSVAARTHRPALRVTMTVLAAVFAETTAGLRVRSGRLLAQGSPHQATLEPCC